MYKFSDIRVLIMFMFDTFPIGEKCDGGRVNQNKKTRKSEKEIEWKTPSFKTPFICIQGINNNTYTVHNILATYKIHYRYRQNVCKRAAQRTSDKTEKDGELYEIIKHKWVMRSICHRHQHSHVFLMPFS